MNKKALKAGVWYTVSNVLLKAVSIITAPIFTRLLTTADYGHVSNFNSWYSILCIFTGLCLYYTVGNAKIDFDETDFYGFISSIQIVAIISGAIWLAASVIFMPVFEDVLEMSSDLVTLLFVFLMTYSAFEIALARYRFEFQYRKNIFLSVCHAFAVVTASLVFILFVNIPRYKGRIYGTYLSAIVFGIILLIENLSRGIHRISIFYAKYALKISLPLIPHALAIILLGQIDRIMIVKMVGTSEAGIYSFGYSYAVVALTLVGAIGQAWQPLLYKYLDEKNISEIRRLNNPLNELIMMAIVALVAVGPEAIMILGERSYWSAKWVVPPVMVGLLFQYFYGNFSSVEFYTKKTYWVAIGSVIAAVVNYLLNFWLIPVFGYQAAAVTTLIGYFVLFCLHWAVSIHTYGRFVYDKKNILICLVMASCMTVVLTGLYNRTIMRYFVFILFFLFIVYRNRKYLLFLMKSYMERHRNR